jgi:hypothetical protein
VQLASVTIELCDKYDCPQFEKIIKNRLLWIVSNELSADPWDFFELACRLEWEPLAKEALKYFGKAWRAAYDNAKLSECRKIPSYFPHEFGHNTMTRLGMKGYGGYTRAFILELARCQGQIYGENFRWDNVARNFSLTDVWYVPWHGATMTLN